MKRHLLPVLCAGIVAGCEPGARPNLQAAAGATSAPAAAAIVAPTNAAAQVPMPPVPALPGPVEEVVRLQQRGLGEGVLLDFVQRVEGPLRLDAAQVIYLNDLGISQPVIQSLLRKSTAPATPPPAVTQTVIVQAAAPTNTAAPAAAAPSSENVILNPYLASTAPAPGPAGQPQFANPTPAAQTVGPVLEGAPQAPPNTPPVAPPQPPVVVNQQIFYDSLSPYGSWVQVPAYGWCWRPTVAVGNPNWMPYCDGGRWLWSDVGWYWHSTYSWGWAPFHYGRWHRGPGFGWVWAPGFDWAPAWVAWRTSPAYCGWAPLPPECRWTAGIGFSWVNGRTSVSLGFGIANDAWFATSWNRFCDPVLPVACLPRAGVTRFVNDSRITVGNGNVVNIRGDNNTVIINDGVGREEVQRHTRGEIRRTGLRDVASPAAATAFAAARPNPAGSGSGPAPSEVPVYRPAVPTHAAAPPPAVLARQEAVRRAPAPSSVAGFPAATPANLSRPLPVPSASGSPAASGSTVSRPPVSPGDARPVPVAAPGVAPGIANRPAPITGLSSTRPAPASSAPMAPVTSVAPGVPSRPAPTPYRNESRRTTPANDSFGRPAPAPVYASPSAPVPAPSRSVGGLRPSPGYAPQGNFAGEVSRPGVPAIPAQPAYGGQYQTKPLPIPGAIPSKPAGAPQSSYTPPPVRNESLRPSPSPGGYGSTAQSAPSYRPSPGNSAAPAPSPAPSSRPSKGPQP